MDLRPQGHEIIRTWLFSTVLRSQLEHARAAVARRRHLGWVLDPDRKKMSKSKGNVVTPMACSRSTAPTPCATGRQRAARDRHRLRHAADEGRPPPGDQDPERLEVRPEPSSATTGPRAPKPSTRPLDLRACCARPRPGSLEEATAAFEGYDYARALERTETFFWSFCDDYLELVKARAYGERPSAPSPTRPAPPWRWPSRSCCGCFAPFLPFVTEEVWSWWQEGSIHRPPGPWLRSWLRCPAAVALQAKRS